MKLLIVGYGRMGRIVESLSAGYGFEVAGVLDVADNADGRGLAAAPAAEVAVEFAVAAATAANLRVLASRGINAVIGTTGLGPHEQELRRIVADEEIGVVVDSNFSLGANLFQTIVDHAARQLAPYGEYGAWIHEAHHAAKQDAPSGTAVTLKAVMEAAGFPRAVDVSSTRAGSIPGIHTVGFDGPSDTITLTHTNRDRGAFARGALEAARWVVGKRGWFTMQDVLGLGK